MVQHCIRIAEIRVRFSVGPLCPILAGLSTSTYSFTHFCAMFAINNYTDKTLPEYLKWQILSFLRTEWPEGFEGNNKFRDWIDVPEKNIVHFMVVRGKLLISYIGLIRITLTFQGDVYSVYGLSGVFTYPSFRGQGHARRVLSG